MALSLGSNTRKRKLNRLLVTHHSLDVIVEILDLSHKYMKDISSQVISGQVNIDVTADVTRSASLELLDPAYRLRLDTESPSEGSLHLTRMIKVTYGVVSINKKERYYVPVFCGPITKVDRSGPVIAIEAQGKEILAQTTVWGSKTFKKNLPKVEVLERIMQAAGEVPRKMQFPENIKSKIPTNMSANRKHTWWKLARRMAKGMNRHLYYDGRGVLRLRHLPSKTQYVFRDNTSLLTAPQVTYDSTGMYNAVEIIGGKPKGSKKKVHVKVVASKKHPLSPYNPQFSRNGQPRYIPMVIEDSSIKSRKEARRVAKRHLRDSLLQSIEVTFDSLPVPYLEELDKCRFATETLSGNFRLKKMTIPLTADGVSTIGYLRRVTPKRQVNKTRRKRNNA